jgi:hypothetical protein
MHTQWQALLNGNITQLSTLRLGDAKSIPAIDVILADGFPAIVDRLKEGLDIEYGSGGWVATKSGRAEGNIPTSLMAAGCRGSASNIQHHLIAPRRLP